MDYEEHTRNAYRNKQKASDYKAQYTVGRKWARFTMWRQKALIQRLLHRCNLTAADRILDIPCGTGFIGHLLQGAQAVVASDISIEMMEFARSEYRGDKFHGFVQADITQAPFLQNSFACVLVLALMHRLPKALRHDVLCEVVNLSSKFVIASYSIDSPSQRMKQMVLRVLRPSHMPAPSSVAVPEIVRELTSHGLNVLYISHVAYFLSAKVVLLSKKNGPEVEGIRG